jgi:hypothetical protein
MPDFEQWSFESFAVLLTIDFVVEQFDCFEVLFFFFLGAHFEV